MGAHYNKYTASITGKEDYSRLSTIRTLKMGYLKYAGHSSFKHSQHSQATVMNYCILPFTPIYCISHYIFLHLRQTILKKTVCAPCGLLLWCCNAPFISSGSFGVTERKLWLYGSHSFSTFWEIHKTAMLRKCLIGCIFFLRAHTGNSHSLFRMKCSIWAVELRLWGRVCSTW